MYYVCFFFCMKKKQKIKLLDHLTEKMREPETGGSNTVVG